MNWHKGVGARTMNKKIWIHRRFSRLGPAEGDVVMHCGHSHATHYFFNASDPVDRLQWIALCQQCFVAHGHEPEIAVEKFAAAHAAT